MLIKKKSMIVAFLSSLLISVVLVLTLVGYLIYVEVRGEEFKRDYREVLKKINAEIYSKHLEVVKLTANIETSGVLKGKPIIDGSIKNTGTRDITNLLIKVSFLDRDGAMMYESVFRPQEPSLGTPILTQVTLPYFSDPTRAILKPNDSLPFKRIMTNCPKEILDALREKTGYAKNAGRWDGKLSLDVLSLDF